MARKKKELPIKVPDKPMWIEELIKHDLSCNIQRTKSEAEYLVAIRGEGKRLPQHNGTAAQPLLQLVDFKTISLHQDSAIYKHPSVPTDLILLD
jgi:hypothetical protein